MEKSCTLAQAYTKFIESGDDKGTRAAYLDTICQQARVKYRNVFDELGKEL